MVSDKNINLNSSGENDNNNELDCAVLNLSMNDLNDNRDYRNIVESEYILGERDDFIPNIEIEINQDKKTISDGNLTAKDNCG